ncbi:hypothetical protein B0H11DRAFT_2274307 [Mycena galericulata]|nr:hypothetical protein B0H11DRAFT_2274307 [Mycena galericulata]
MDDGRDLPPLPIPPPSEVPVAESSRRHSHRSKDRYSARELATLLLLEQREHRETERELSRVSEQLRLETARADEADRRVLEVTERLKSVNEARLTALREAARANESLGLYKFQLENAQNEIFRAQSVFDIVEKERYHAELQGAKSRTAARRLHEQHKIHLAREEGRRMGLQEGLEAGRLGLRDELGNPPPVSNFGDSQFDDYDGDNFDDEELSPIDFDALELDAPSPPRDRTPNNNLRDAPDPIPVPPPVPQPVPVPAPKTGPATAPLSPFVPFHDIHPTPVHNGVPHPRHEPIDVPPDGYIPGTGPDSLPLVPPPHEFLHHREPSSPHRSRVSSAVEDHVRAPSAFARTMSPRQHNDYRSPSQLARSVRAESVQRAPSVAGSVRPVQMPTPRMDTNIPGIESQAQQRASWASDSYGGGQYTQAPLTNTSSGPIEINVMPPSRPDSYVSSGQFGTPSMGSNLFGPGGAPPTGAARGAPLPNIYGPPAPAAFGNPPAGAPTEFVPSAFQQNRNGGASASPMPGSYTLPSEGPAGPADPPYDPFDEHDSESTHSSDLQTSTPNTLTTPPETRRPHPHKPPRKKNPAAWPRDPGYERPPKNPTGPGFGYDGNVGSTSGAQGQ